jgi:hypothetical protein
MCGRPPKGRPPIPHSPGPWILISELPQLPLALSITIKIHLCHLHNRARSAVPSSILAPLLTLPLIRRALIRPDVRSWARRGDAPASGVECTTSASGTPSHIRPASSTAGASAAGESVCSALQSARYGTTIKRCMRREADIFLQMNAHTHTHTHTHTYSRHTRRCTVHVIAYVSRCMAEIRKHVKNQDYTNVLGNAPAS